MSGIGRQFLVNTNLINVCLFLLPICNDEEEIIKCLKDTKNDDDDDNALMMKMVIVMMRSDNENVGKAERRLITAEDNDNHDNDDYNHDNDKQGNNHAIDNDDEERG